ncbi:hypothetical protein LMOh7858_1841 [Listeria monocytogenes str. 4b H7858]|nr:hypothetical protein LMOh7858_1841 [Listeria monocytogenes str. 4b H7858] [Listeria monocytogenes serotype 4b str. H7858]
MIPPKMISVIFFLFVIFVIIKVLSWVFSFEIILIIFQNNCIIILTCKSITFEIY